MSSSSVPQPPVGELRERRTGPDSSVQELTGDSPAPTQENEVERPKKTFGRTPDGTVFTVPVTHDMVSQLLDPRQPKNLSDLIVLAILAFHIAALYLLPQSLRRPFFAVIFLFWRAAYNVGIGYLLQAQSNQRKMVTWAKQLHLFDHPSTGKNPRPWLYPVLKRELETKIPEDYKFEEAPIEYNAWLVFRRVVDLILMCDFTSYCLFAIACGSRPVGESSVLAILRWTAGIVLVGFNLWVKLDAHRVVKDYAWYWGDFFYLIDQELTFDGVFEMAPHPMYSVGYAGYYGISLMAASYSVLFISVIAHAAQFAFLVYIENPHIDKTYNPPPPRKRTPAQTASETQLDLSVNESRESVNIEAPGSPVAPPQPTNTHNLIGLGNIDLYRITDISVLLLQAYVLLVTIVTPSTPFFKAIFIINAIVWRLWVSVGLGVILQQQSNNKRWTRHFLKYAESTMEAWRQWKGMYHLSLTMCYVSFVAACWKMYSFPTDWGYGLVLLYHILGAGMVALQIWISVSIYESLGEFGWFFGDFFFDQAPKLTYSGIYRYLNNPERILGLAGIWGAVFITRSITIFCLTLFSHLLSLAFIQFVEKPHMQKVYGMSVRKEAGLTKSIKRSLPPPIAQLGGSVDKVFSETTHFVEECIEAARPKFANGVSTFMRDTTALFSQYPARLTITRLAPDLAGYDPKDYSIEIEGTPSALWLDSERSSGKEGEMARLSSQANPESTKRVFEYGAPIRVKWTAPVNHSKKDWIGLYKVTDNVSREVTRLPSAGRWISTNRNEYEDESANNGILSYEELLPGTSRKDGSTGDIVTGEMVFEGDKLWWTQGVFEFRYHHDGKHNVMAISQPFEVRIGRFDEEDVEVDANGMIRGAVEQALLPVVRNCLDRDPDVAPNTVDERFGSIVERDGKYAKRIVYAVLQMFGIEFAPGVVLADGNVRNLAWRICNAKQVLAPYSMSTSRGRSTPVNETC